MDQIPSLSYGKVLGSEATVVVIFTVEMQLAESLKHRYETITSMRKIMWFFFYYNI